MKPIIRLPISNMMRRRLPEVKFLVFDGRFWISPAWWIDSENCTVDVAQRKGFWRDLLLKREPFVLARPDWIYTASNKEKILRSLGIRQASKTPVFGIDAVHSFLSAMSIQIGSQGMSVEQAVQSTYVDFCTHRVTLLYAPSLETPQETANIHLAGITTRGLLGCSRAEKLLCGIHRRYIDAMVTPGASDTDLRPLEIRAGFCNNSVDGYRHITGRPGTLIFTRLVRGIMLCAFTQEQKPCFGFLSDDGPRPSWADLPGICPEIADLIRSYIPRSGKKLSSWKDAERRRKA